VDTHGDGLLVRFRGGSGRSSARRLVLGRDSPGDIEQLGEYGLAERRVEGVRRDEVRRPSEGLLEESLHTDEVKQAGRPGELHELRSARTGLPIGMRAATPSWIPARCHGTVADHSPAVPDSKPSRNRAGATFHTCTAVSPHGPASLSVT